MSSENNEIAEDDCFACGETLPESDLQTVEVQGDCYEVCGDCFSDVVVRCDNCPSSDWRDEITEFDGDDWCTRCRDRNLEYCNSCGNYFPGDEECSVCTSRGVNPYSYNPVLQFRSVKDGVLVIKGEGYQGNALHIGAEIETETIYGNNVRDTADSFLASDFFYLKDDCSLEHGFEVVTHPATIDSWRLLHDEFAPVFADAVLNGARAWDRSRCGLHFHLSRVAFSPAHVMRFHKFIMENSKEMMQFAGRESEHYASFTSDDGKASDRAKGRHQDYRNCAINYLNTATIELRFFRPTLSASALLAIVEFVSAVYDYTKQLRVADLVDGSFPFAGFVDWLARSEYSGAFARVEMRCN